MNTYQPGDRVQYTHHERSLIPAGSLGTVVQSTRADYPFAVKFDDPDLNNARSWPDNIRKWADAKLFERQPVKPGCHVRSLDNQIRGVVSDLYDTAGGKSYAILKDGLNIGLDFLARIADPEPVATVTVGGLKMEAFADGTTRHSMEAAGETLRTRTPLEQAQDLARAIHAKHFAMEQPTGWTVADDLTGVLLQIDNMTAGMAPTNIGDALDRRNKRISELETSLAAMKETAENNGRTANRLDNEISRLAEYIMHNVDGEPCKPDEGAVDCAIRIMRDWSEQIISMKDKLAPEQPTFKRGDLVTWGHGKVNYRLVNYPETERPELMSEDGTHFRSDVNRSALRHANH